MSSQDGVGDHVVLLGIPRAANTVLNFGFKGVWGCGEQLPEDSKSFLGLWSLQAVAVTKAGTLSSVQHYAMGAAV